LAEAGLVPDNCRLLEIQIGVTGVLMLRYEICATPDQLVTLGAVLQRVGAQVIHEEG
jgi:hypothetical protein